MSIQNHNNPVVESIKGIIKNKGLKQNAVAEKSGYSAREFNDMLNGRKLIKACDIPNISRALEVQPNELFLMKD